MDLEKLYSILSRVQRPAKYLGNEVNSIHKDFDSAAVKICLVFPDAYEVGMSHMGLKILHEILNRIPDVVCERSFAPGVDLEKELRKEGLPLFSLESKHPLSDFDIVGFSLTYELTYTNMVTILDLGGIPVWQRDRKDTDPLVIAGGGCTMNAEPVADFLDAAALGDGEDLILNIVDAVRHWKSLPRPGRDKLLDVLSNIEGIYVPSFFKPEYNGDGTLSRMAPLKEGYTRINKRIVSDIDRAPYPTKTIVPSVKPIHDRIGIEIQRGCNRACRFCQAGYIDRPVRQRAPETILKIAEESLKNTGIDEISLLSLSAADYNCLVPLLATINKRYEGENVVLSVPATRTEKLTPDLIEQIKKVRKTGFTIAPEAGSEKMRRVINKGNKADDLYRAVTDSFSAGWELLKLYYMVGLPFEADEDLEGIAREANESIRICLRYTKRADLNLSLSSFVPKPHTPFQWEPQIGIQETREKYDRVKKNLRNRRIHLKHHNPEMSYLEGIMSRGDRRVSALIHAAFLEGCRFDEWEEHFDFSKWQRAIEKWGQDPAFYLHRKRTKDEVLPWDHLFAQMDKGFLWEELERAHDVAREYRTTDFVGANPCVRPDRTPRRKGPQPLPDQLAGFTEDCSVARCSDCGVCDFREVKNRIYVKGEEPVVAKRGHREWYGWNSPLTARSEKFKGQSEKGPSSTGDTPLRLRVRFSKSGEARFMGHLELMEALRRAVRRAGIPACYSEGFHPQLRLSLGHPLPVGIESQWEFFDLDLYRTIDFETDLPRLNGSLPHGLTIISGDLVDRKIPSLYSSISEISYRAEFWAPEKKWSEATRHGLLRYQESSGPVLWARRKENEVRNFNLKEFVSFGLGNFPEAIVFGIKVRPEGFPGPRSVLTIAAGLTEEEVSGVRLEKIQVRWSGIDNPPLSVRVE